MPPKRKLREGETPAEGDAVSLPPSPAKEKPGKKDGAKQDAGKKVAGKKDAEEAADDGHTASDESDDDESLAAKQARVKRMRHKADL